MQPNLATHPARRLPAWGVAATAIIAVASAFVTVGAQRDDALAINSTPPDRPLPRAENARTEDDAGGVSCALVDRIVVAAFGQGPLTLHL